MKWWLVGAMVLFASIFLLNAYFKKITYPAKMTFVVNTNNSNSLNLGGVSSILGQFGLGRSARVGGTNIDRLVELSKSERIIQNALFQKVEMFKDTNFIANHILSIYDQERKVWSKEIAKANNLVATALDDFTFTHATFSEFTLVEQYFFNELYWDLGTSIIYLV